MILLLMRVTTLLEKSVRIRCFYHTVTRRSMFIIRNTGLAEYINDYDDNLASKDYVLNFNDKKIKDIEHY
jgi:hypothetical protein